MPEARIKRLANENIKVARLAEPITHPNENIVDVNYTLFIYDKFKKTTDEINESHKMRYFFIPEIRFMLEQCGFELSETLEIESGRRLGFSTWSATAVSIKK